jgi:TonB family protein
MTGNDFPAERKISRRKGPQVPGARRASLVCFALILAAHLCALEIYAKFSRPVQGKQAQRRETLITFEFDAGAPAEEPVQAPAAVKPVVEPVEAAALTEIRETEAAAEAALPHEAPLLPETGAADHAAAGSAGGEEGAAEEGAAETFSSSYLALVLQLLEANKVYPYSARRRGLEGEVLLSFVIERDGRPKKIEASGAHAFLVDAARESIRRASPFPPPEGDVFEASLTISYRLE